MSIQTHCTLLKNIGVFLDEARLVGDVVCQVEIDY